MGIANNRWNRKIVALLHDPPDKPFSIVGHKDRASELQRLALNREPEEDEITRAERADWIASAADRVNFPKGMETFWQQEQAVLTHPLAGLTLELGKMTDLSAKDTHKAAQKALEQLVENVDDAQQRYLRLWRLLPHVLAEEFPRVGKLFEMLPADTRQPDHPLFQHLSITAAIADSLPQPALLVFSIGPVQEFIAAARRTQDLWMGSWLLSYLSWSAMKSLSETYGPDVILYPSLREQPLCDFWLAHEKQLPLEEPRPENLALASLPNKFVALVPASEAKEAARTAEQAVRNEWERLADAVFTKLKNDIMPVDEITHRMWTDQVKTHLEVYWTILPWPGEHENSSAKQADTVKSLFQNMCRPEPDWRFGRIYLLYAGTKTESSGQYEPNWGTTYSLLYTLADRAFNARKNLRNFSPTEEKGEKCTVCGQRAALHGRDGSSSGVREFWSQSANNLKAKKRYLEIKPKGRERLCAICTIKRFIHQEVLEEHFNLKVKFPSTSEVTAALFKAALLEKLSEAQHGDKLASPLSEHLRSLYSLNFPTTFSGKAIPKLQKTLAEYLPLIPQKLRKDAEKLLYYDGEALFPETFTVNRLKDDYDLDDLAEIESKAESARKSLQKLLTVARQAGIPSPSKYYAVLVMDGDHAGRWLSGTHEGLTTLGRVLHPAVRNQLEVLPEWKDLLREPRLITPGLHAAISEALANFALKLVRFVVEERHMGRVVYAGGDDVLAFLPLEEVLVAAQELRGIFSGEILFKDTSYGDLRTQPWDVKFKDPKCTGYLWFEGAPRLTMGPSATASIGIAVAHYLQPLDVVLHTARQAEKTAKEVYGRNALCVHLLKRSGEEICVGGRWSYPNIPLPTITLMVELYKQFQEEKLAMRLARSLAEEAPTLANLSPEAQRAELKRLLKRHSEGKMSDEERNNLAESLTALSFALNEHTEKVDKRGFEQLAEWLLLVLFLARRGEE